MPPVDLSAFFTTLARLSGQAILPFFRTDLAVIDKRTAEKGSGFDPVTDADRAAETVLRRAILTQFPDHGLLGEEFGTQNEKAEYRWVIDPIDGTRAFLCGLPVWGTLIGLLHNGAPVMGMMSQPYLQEIFLGDGAQTTLKTPQGTRRLFTRRCETLLQARLMTTDPRLFSNQESKAFRALEAVVQLSRYGTDCYAYCMLAAGQIDLVVEAGLKPYDILPLVPIIEGAGGIVTDWQGNALNETQKPHAIRVLAAANPVLHQAALDYLKKA